MSDRTIDTLDEMQELFNGDSNVVLLDEDGGILQNLMGGWASPGSTFFMHSDLAFHVYGPKFTVIHEVTT